eukprot:9751170-Alexandrium_andersonii.AAC.1
MGRLDRGGGRNAPVDEPGQAHAGILGATEPGSGGAPASASAAEQAAGMDLSGLRSGPPRLGPGNVPGLWRAEAGLARALAGGTGVARPEAQGEGKEERQGQRHPQADRAEDPGCPEGSGGADQVGANARPGEQRGLGRGRGDVRRGGPGRSQGA